MKFEKAINYEEFAVAQKFAALNLINLLKKYTQNFKNVYEIGAGSGVLTKLFIQNFNYEHLILNDIYKSEFMNNFYIDIGDITTKQMPKNIDIIEYRTVQACKQACIVNWGKGLQRCMPGVLGREQPNRYRCGFFTCNS